MNAGAVWIVDAHGCEPQALRSKERVAAVFDAAVRELRLNPVGESRWHVFPDPGGVTGMLMLGESHLACHTFPETGLATFDLHCCRPREEWPWGERLATLLGARRVVVRRLDRGEAAQ